VAAAKKKNATSGKKRIVITDETIKTSTGHITTTKIQPTINIPVVAKTAEQSLAESKAKEKERAAERAKLEKAAADKKQKAMARAAAAADDEGPFDTDPASTEHKLDQQQQPAGSPTPSTTTSAPATQTRHDDAQHR
jgi:hypothetical protein